MSDSHAKDRAALIRIVARVTDDALALLKSLVPFVGEIISLLLTPAQDPRLMQNSSFSCLSLVELFPFRNWNFSGSVASPKSSKSILKHPCWVLEQTLVLRTFCANIEPHFGLV